MSKNEFKYNPKDELFFGILFTLVSLFFVIWSFVYTRNYNNNIDTYKEVSAIVVDYDVSSTDENSKAIVVGYIVNGNSYRKTSTKYSNNNQAIGSSVDILYNPADPTDIIWSNKKSSYLVTFISLIFVGIGLYTSLYAYNKMDKKAKNKQIDDNMNKLFN